MLTDSFDFCNCFLVFGFTPNRLKWAWNTSNKNLILVFQLFLWLPLTDKSFSVVLSSCLPFSLIVDYATCNNEKGCWLLLFSHFAGFANGKTVFIFLIGGCFGEIGCDFHLRCPYLTQKTNLLRDCDFLLLSRTFILQSIFSYRCGNILPLRNLSDSFYLSLKPQNYALAHLSFIKMKISQ